VGVWARAAQAPTVSESATTTAMIQPLGRIVEVYARRCATERVSL